VFCDISDLDGTPFQGCPRHVLRRTLQSAVERGFTFYAAPEIEYFYFADGDPGHPPQTLDAGSYFELTGADQTSDIRQRTVLTLEEMGIPSSTPSTRTPPASTRSTCATTDALTMADTVMSVRLVVKEMARQQGVHASFMPSRWPGSRDRGCTPTSRCSGGDQRLRRPGPPPRPLRGGRGVHRRPAPHAGEITAITNQWVNSYKRLVTGYEAPIHVSWARNNRSP